jgi:undecaprenyl-diphosphatase
VPDPEVTARAVETLGGTPPGTRRGPSPGVVLPGSWRGRIERFDKDVDRAFDHLRGRHAVIDKGFYAASELADFSLLWQLLGAANGLRSERHLRAWARMAVALGIESVLVNGVIKGLFRRTRPPWEVERPRHLRKPRSSSFPSGHASSAFLAATLLTDEDPALRPVYLLAAFVAASRVHVRIHHASDVVAGAALGLALGALTKRLVPLPPASAPGNATRR